jgi:hypothetical protein
MEEMRSVVKIIFGKQVQRDHLEDLSTDGRIIL